MTHNSRCENSKRDRKFCKCSCAGTYHGGEENGGLAPDEIRIDESYGGEVAEFIREARGKEYYCMGSHKSYDPAVTCHFANEFFAYPHDGGLADKTGRKWWVFVKCDNPPKNGGAYATSFAHFRGAVDKAKLEHEYEDEILWENEQESMADAERAKNPPWERDF